MSGARLWLTCLAGLLAGCAPSLEALRTDPSIPPVWPAAAQVREQAPHIPQDWREVYADPDLQALIDTALNHNRSLRLALARVAEARAVLGLSAADRRPTLALAASAASRRESENTTRRIEAALQLPAYELDLWGRLASLDEAALQRYLASREAARAVELTLIAEVAQLHLTRLELKERLAIARDTLDNRLQSRTLLARRQAVGLAGRLELLQAEALVELAQAETARLTRGLNAAENALALLLGAAPPPLKPDAGLHAELVAPVRPGLASEVLLARPDVRAAEHQLAASQADVEAVRTAFLPRITLTAALGLASPALRGLFDAASGAWLFQPALTHPLVDGGRLQANLDLARTRAQTAVIEYERVLQQAFREVADLLTARQALADELESLTRQVRTQAERLRLAEARQRAGLVSYLEVLDAQRDHYAARQGEIELRAALLVNSVRLYQALGGGGNNPRNEGARTKP